MGCNDILHVVASWPSASSKYRNASRDAILRRLVRRCSVDKLWWYVVVSNESPFSFAELVIGVIADVWDAAGRGLATSLFVACVFLGPVLGPIVGSL